MNLAHLLNAEAIGREALKLDPAQRAAFLTQRCGDDAKLRAEVEFFLNMHEQPPGTQTAEAPKAPREARPPVEVKVQAESPSRNAKLPVSRIGAYRILEQIGQGGFGIVYLAEQEQPVRRRVALKVIKLGMDTPEVLARFEAERQALAMMDHPGVARVFDAGTTEQGRPYFAMEYVQGVPIVEYCDKQRLNNRERLQLFVHVCEAIQHAHQKGIIHRDLKPSNILVSIQDEHPVPKVIDFGIAKALHQRLTEHTIYTERGQIIGTPEYMSPEQAEMSGLDIDTRTDIYSLGVILYQLLIGSLPFDSAELRRAGILEIQRVIREQEPAKPSTKLGTLAEATRSIAHNRSTDPDTLIRQMKGDLDWITLKAMEKDRTRRYASASEFAADVQRYLHDEPVSASPPSAAYRMRKFVRRNRGFVAAATAVSLALVAGLSAATYGLVQARVERDKTAKERDRAEKERDRAVAAEAESERMLAESYFQAGTLARQRGNWKVALDSFKKAIAAGHAEQVGIRLAMLPCYEGSNDAKGTAAVVKELSTRSDLGRYRGSLSLWQAKVMFRKNKRKAIRLLKTAIAEGLSPAEEAFAKGLMGETMPEVAANMDLALRLDPFNFEALAMSAMMHQYAGEWGAARDRFGAYWRLFPGDSSAYVGLLDLMLLQGDASSAEELITTIGTREGEARAKELTELKDALLEDAKASRTLAADQQPTDGAAPSKSTLATGMRAAALKVRLVAQGHSTSATAAAGIPAVDAWLGGPKGIALNAIGNRKAALEFVREARRSSPVSESAFAVGSVLWSSGKYVEATAALWEGARLPESGLGGRDRCLRNAIRCGIKASEDKATKPEERIELDRMLRAAIQEYLSRGLAGEDDCAIAGCARRLGDHERANALVLSALRQKPSDVAALLLRAELDLDRGAAGPAIESAAAALGIAPKNKAARKILKEALGAVGMIGPRGVGVPVDEFLRANVPSTAGERATGATSAPAAPTDE